MVSMLDLTGLGYFLPIIGFLFIFVMVYALLHKTKILGENAFINALIGFIVAIIFSVTSSTQEYVRTVTPWFAVLIVAMFFILVLIGLSQQKITDIMKPWFVWVFIVVLIVIFVLSAIIVFSGTFYGAYDQLNNFMTAEGKIGGAIVLLVIAAITAWVITRK